MRCSLLGSNFHDLNPFKDDFDPETPLLSDYSLATPLRTPIHITVHDSPKRRQMKIKDKDNRNRPNAQNVSHYPHLRAQNKVARVPHPRSPPFGSVSNAIERISFQTPTPIGRSRYAVYVDVFGVPE